MTVQGVEVMENAEGGFYLLDLLWHIELHCHKPLSDIKREIGIYQHLL